MGATYYVKVVKAAGKKAVLDCLPSGAGTAKDYASSRSFAVMLLHDAAGLRKGVTSPIEDALPTYRAKGMERSWYEQNVGQIITSTRVIARRNDLEESVLDERYEELRENGDFEERAWKQLFHYQLEVVVQDATFLRHLKPGLEFSTIGFDIWREGVAAIARPAAVPKTAEKKPKSAPSKGGSALMRKVASSNLDAIWDLDEQAIASAGLDLAEVVAALRAQLAPDKSVHIRALRRLHALSEKDIPLLVEAAKTNMQQPALALSDLGATSDLAVSALIDLFLHEVGVLESKLEEHAALLGREEFERQRRSSGSMFSSLDNMYALKALGRLRSRAAPAVPIVAKRLEKRLRGNIKVGDLLEPDVRHWLLFFVQTASADTPRILLTEIVKLTRGDADDYKYFGAGLHRLALAGLAASGKTTPQKLQECIALLFHPNIFSNTPKLDEATALVCLWPLLGKDAVKCLPTLEGFLSELMKKLADDRIADRDLDRVSEIVDQLLAIVESFGQKDVGKYLQALRKTVEKSSTQAKRIDKAIAHL